MFFRLSVPFSLHNAGKRRRRRKRILQEVGRRRKEEEEEGPLFALLTFRRRIKDGKRRGIVVYVGQTRFCPEQHFLFPMNTGLSNGNPAEGKQHIFKKIWALSRICAVKKEERRGRKKKRLGKHMLGGEGEGGNKICRTQKETTSNHSFPFPPPPSLYCCSCLGGRKEGRLLVYVRVAVYQKKGCVHTLHGCCCCSGQFIVCFPVECFQPSQMRGCVAAPFFETAAYGGRIFCQS